MLTNPISNSSIDFVLVTALPEERDAVLHKLAGHSRLPPTDDDIRTYFQADLPVVFADQSTGSYRVIVMCLLSMGRVQAVSATADAIRRWHPRYVLLIGIAGGIAARRVKVGDILIANQVVDYELQKLTPAGPEVRWDVQRTDARLLDACVNFRNENWEDLLRIKRPGRGKPNRHIGPLASGDKVIAFSDVVAKYRNSWPKLLGVEMEAAGASIAAFQAPTKPGFFMIRGVSDLADENKGASHVEKWRTYACDVAASFAIALLQSGPIMLSNDHKAPPLAGQTAIVTPVLAKPPHQITLREALLVLRSALLALYDSPTRIRRLMDDAGVDAGVINFQEAAQEIWHHVLTLTERTEQTEALVRAVDKPYQRNKALQQAYQAYQQAKQAVATNLPVGNSGTQITINTSSGDFVGRDQNK